MYAIVASGGKQFRVHAGDLVRIEQRPGAVGDRLTFDRVLVVGEPAENTLELGQPVVKDARVVGTIVEQGKGGKVRVFRFKRRKRYRRLYGHRQTYTRVRIEEIQMAGAKPPKPSQAKAAPSEAEAEPAKGTAAATTTKKTAKKKATKKAVPAQVTKKTARKTASKKATAKAPAAGKTQKKAAKKAPARSKKTTKKEE